MNEYQEQLIFQFLDKGLSGAKEAEVLALLESDPEARALVQSVAEHAVVFPEIDPAESVTPPPQQQENPDRSERREDVEEPSSESNESSRRDQKSSRKRRAALQASPSRSRSSDLDEDEEDEDESDSNYAAVASRRRQFIEFVLGSLSGLVLIAMAISAFSGGADDLGHIGEVLEIHGPVRWVESNGIVKLDLKASNRLTGGTLETMSPETWVAMKFNDGSKFTIHGISNVTFSDIRGKEIDLRFGSLSATVEPQPNESPLRIQTGAVTIELLDAQVNVTSDSVQTRLNVNEGKVQVSRLVDNQTCEVGRKRELLVSLNKNDNLAPQPYGFSKSAWKARFDVEPNGYLGNWVPTVAESQGHLSAVPVAWKTKDNKPQQIRVVTVSPQEDAAIELNSSAKFILRGSLDQLDGKLIFVARTREPVGGFAGNFYHNIEIKRLKNDPSKTTWEAVLPLDRFQARSVDQPSTAIDGLVLTEVVAVVEGGDASNLKIFEIELVPSS